jgi:hypothetical protein
MHGVDTSMEVCGSAGKMEKVTFCLFVVDIPKDKG